jgi:DIS3-like exonuclease 2
MFTLNDIKASVLNLHCIAQQLRAKRFRSGCLTLNQPKLNFIINKESGLPYAFKVNEQKESHRLVEEFMLLANMAVARKIHATYPHKSILRRHPQPNATQIQQLGESIRLHGYQCDVNSSSSIQVCVYSVRMSPVDHHSYFKVLIILY